MTTAKKPVDPRDQLIAAGLLPNPAGENSAAYGTAAAASSEHPMLRLYEANMRRLSEEIVVADQYADRTETKYGELLGRTARRADALRWLRDNYELDELALEVIAHALAHPANQPARSAEH